MSHRSRAKLRTEQLESKRLFAGDLATGGFEGGATIEDRVAAIYDRYDANEDELIDATEVSERAWTRLSNADADEDGFVSTEELTAKIEARIAERTPPTSAEIVERLMTEYDANEDGLLVADEVSERRWERISVADTDGDEAVSTEELTAHIDAAMADMDGEDGEDNGRRNRRGRGRGR